MGRVLVLLTATVGLVVGLIVSATPAGAALPSWQRAATLSLGTQGVGLDCPTASTCWALESGRLLSSTDGGAGWTDRTALVPDTVGALLDVACPTASRCYLAASTDAGAGLVLVLDHGALTQHAVPAPLVTLTCPRAQLCVGATDTTSYVTSDGGVSWSSASLGRTLLGTPDVDCVPLTSVCTLVGNYGLVPTILRSTTTGRSWSPQSAPYDDGGIYAVACPTTETCYATGADYPDDALVVRTTDAGKHWTFATVPFQQYALRSVSCPAETTCTAVGHSPGETPFVFTTADGATWTRATIDPVATAEPAQVSCPTLTTCAAVASAAAFDSTDGGSTWQTVDVPAALEAPQALTCATALRCVAVGADAGAAPFVLTTVDGGTTWTPGAFPDGTGRPAAVDCPTRTTCYALATVPVPGTGRTRTQVLTSGDTGATWALTAERAGTLGALHCPAETTCIATGYDNHSQPSVYRTTDARHWLAVGAPGSGSLAGAACGSVTSCVFLIGTYGGSWTAYTTDDLGTTFHPHAIPAADWFGLDCAGSFCTAAGAASSSGTGALATSSDGGVSWNPATAPPQAQLIEKVSCGSPTSCAASTYDFDSETGGPRIVGTRDGGLTWKVFAVPARHEAPIDVACSGTHCIGSDYSDNARPIIVAGPA